MLNTVSFLPNPARAKLCNIKFAKWTESNHRKKGIGKLAIRWTPLLALLGLVITPSSSQALVVTPCDQSTPNVICGVSGTEPSGSSFSYNLTSGTPSAVYGGQPDFIVTTKEAATSLMTASANALNAFAAALPFNNSTPPVLFGSSAYRQFDIVYEYVPGDRVWNASRSRWEVVGVDDGRRWEIAVQDVRIKDDELTTLTTKVPSPIPLLGIAAAFGYTRKLRNRVKGGQAAPACQYN
jgi:hypothetical protein